MDRRRALATLLALPACRPRGGGPGVTEETPRPFAAEAPSTSAPAAASVEPEPPSYPPDAPVRTLAKGELAAHEWILPAPFHRAVVLVPKHLGPQERVPMLVALHGLGETGDDKLGAWAWVDRYGIDEGYAHARAPETISVASLGKMATEGRVAELKQELAAKPFRGMVIVCPYTPNIWKGDPELVVDAYTRWLFEKLIPRVRNQCPVDHRLAVDGVSLGGWVSLGVAVRKTAELHSIGCVQAAVSGDLPYGPRLQKAFADAGTRPLQLLTSDQDVFKSSVQQLAAGLNKRGVPHVLRVAKGPHDQPFLRGPGSLEMLHFQARALAG